MIHWINGKYRTCFAVRLGEREEVDIVIRLKLEALGYGE